jgi:hypothetical protein
VNGARKTDADTVVKDYKGGRVCAGQYEVGKDSDPSSRKWNKMVCWTRYLLVETGRLKTAVFVSRERLGWQLFLRAN